MAKITILFAILLVSLGLIGFLGTGAQHPTALIPTWIGLVLGIGGALAQSPDPKRRKLLMHINVTVALLGFLGSLGEIIRSSVKSASTGAAPAAAAVFSKYALTALLLVYVILCVRSFIAARKARLV
jgi:hypothetical protein